MTTTVEELEHRQHSPPARPEAATASEQSAASRVVLIADDNLDAANSLSMLLVHLGCKVHVAYDGLAAMRSAELVRPHAAVLDIAMPGASGHEVARWIRRQDWGSATRLIALTAFGEARDIERAREAGFDMHLRKPAGPHELMQALGISFGAFQGNADS